jgi:hypothetical protein
LQEERLVLLCGWYGALIVIEEKGMRMRSRIVFLLAVIALALCTVPVPRLKKVVAGETTTMRQGQSVAQSNQPTPHISYWLVFQHIAQLNQQAEEAEKKGEDGSRYHKRYQQLAGLTDQQAEILNTIALDTLNHVARIDAIAKAVVAEIRARTPEGQLRPGEKAPEVPTELKQMQDQRNQLILSGYNKLRGAFGETAFTSFDKFVNEQSGTRQSAESTGIIERDNPVLSVSSVANFHPPEKRSTGARNK